MNSWTNLYYHNPAGKILGSIVPCGDKYKALIDSMFIGWFISEEHAKTAVESAYEDSIDGEGKSLYPSERSIKGEYRGARYAAG